MDSLTRPVGVTIISAVLVLVGLATGLAGFALSEATTILGGEYDGVYVGVGLLVCGALLAGAVGLWTGAAPGWLVICLAASFPLMCMIGALSSVDLASLAPLAVIAWLALWWLLRRPGIVAWLRARDDRPDLAGGDSWL
jgi:hypothetical protein